MEIKIHKFNALAGVLTLSAALAGCAGIGSMVKKAGTVTYEVTPKPLEVHGDSVAVSINGKYPAKYFAKKVVLTATPSIKSEASEKELKSKTVQGESAEGSNEKIKFKEGGSFTYSDKVAYNPDMKVSTLDIKGTVTQKTKSKPLPRVTIAEGVITTSLLVQNDEKSIMAKDNYTGPPINTYPHTIYYLVNQAVVRPAEAKMLNDTIKSSVKAGLNFKGINVAGYASPDGEMGKNEKLADQRAEAAKKHITGELVKNKAIAAKANIDTAVQKSATPEDWDGFKNQVSSSTLAGKDKVLEIANGSADPESKEKEIRALPDYKDISKEIMPKLRRADVKVSFQAREKTKEEIQRLAVSAPDSLSAEELLFGASLNEDPNAKLNIYKAYAQHFPEDWRGHNNVGYIMLTQKNLTEAAPWIEKANSLSANNPIVLNNLGVIARWRGDRKGAEDYYNQATAAGKEVTYNLGVLDVMRGNYADALTKFADACSFNAALANVLAGKPQDGMSIIECSDYKSAAIGFYLKAIISARTNNAEAVVANLKKAIAADASLKSKAKIDLEFRAFRTNADFKSTVE